MGGSEIEKDMRDETGWILGVDLYGKEGDMKGIWGIGKKHGVKMIEDGCEGMGRRGVGGYGDGVVVRFNA